MAETLLNRPLQCVMVTPERALLDEQADFVALPMYDGELGVLPGRSPLIGRLGYGELRIRRGQETRRFFVDGGFAQVRANTVTVLTGRALKAEEIDAAEAERTLHETQPAAATPEVTEALHKAQERARRSCGWHSMVQCLREERRIEEEPPCHPKTVRATASIASSNSSMRLHRMLRMRIHMNPPPAEPAASIGFTGSRMTLQTPARTRLHEPPSRKRGHNYMSAGPS